MEGVGGGRTYHTNACVWRPVAYIQAPLAEDFNAKILETICNPVNKQFNPLLFVVSLSLLTGSMQRAPSSASTINRNNRSLVGIQLSNMAHKSVSMRVTKVRKCSPAARSPMLAELVKDYQTATEQYGVIIRYLRGALEVLPKPECQLLLEFGEIEKNHCERLHREIHDRLAAERRGA
jgi:hypothetical protein